MPVTGGKKHIICTARCDDCGNSSPNTSWSPGTACPQCGSHHFAPVPVIRKGSDYDSADRSQGFAIEDVRFGRMALWAGLISAKRLQLALHQQRQVAQSGRPPIDLAKMLKEQKHISTKEANAVMSALLRDSDPGGDAEFAIAAIQSGYVRESQVEACKRIQLSMTQAGKDAPPLPLLLHEKRHLQENQILALLKTAAQRQSGLLHNIAQDVSGSSGGFFEKTFGSGDDAIATPKQAALLAALLLFIIFIGIKKMHKTTYAETWCIECLTQAGAQSDSAWPIRCTECKKNAVYPQGICLQCAESYPIQGMGYGVKCPECGSGMYKLKTNDLDLEKLKNEIESGTTQ